MQVKLSLVQNMLAIIQVLINGIDLILLLILTIQRYKGFYSDYKTKFNELILTTYDSLRIY